MTALGAPTHTHTVYLLTHSHNTLIDMQNLEIKGDEMKLQCRYGAEVIKKKGSIQTNAI